MKVYYVYKKETPDKILIGGVKGFIGFQEVTCHIIFNVKMEFSIKSQMVANGAITEAPLSLTYSCVVSRDSVCLDFLISGLNNLYVMECDVGNQYLNASCQ